MGQPTLGGRYQCYFAVLCYIECLFENDLCCKCRVRIRIYCRPHGGGLLGGPPEGCGTQQRGVGQPRLESKYHYCFAVLCYIRCGVECDFAANERSCAWVFNTWFLGPAGPLSFGVWAAPAAPITIPKGGGLRPPPSEIVLRAAGDAQTPKIDDSQPAQKQTQVLIRTKVWFLGKAPRGDSPGQRIPGAALLFCITLGVG